MKNAEENKKKNKRTLKVVGGLIAFFVLVGACGAMGQDATPAATDKSVSAQEKAPVSVDPTVSPKPKKAVESKDHKQKRLFHAYIDDKLQNVSPTEAEQGAVSVCLHLNLGDSMSEVAMREVGKHGPLDGGYVMGAGIGAFCPEYSNDLQAWVKSNG